MNEQIITQISQELNIRPYQTEAVVKLIDEGNTIPFIARYRKEMHGSLDDEQIRNISERLIYLRNLMEKKEKVIESIDEQGLLTNELKEKILLATTQVEVDDLYRPYRPKRRTRATIAVEKGLSPLADIIMLQMTSKSIEEEAAAYVSEEKGVADVSEAIAGACDIIAEAISDNADYRTAIRDITRKTGTIESAAKDKEEKSVYENYYEFSETIAKVAGYEILAINRGENEKYLTVKIKADDDKILRFLERKVVTNDNPNTRPYLIEAIKDSYNRLIAPSIEREIRNELTLMAEDGAIGVFG